MLLHGLPLQRLRDNHPEWFESSASSSAPEAGTKAGMVRPGRRVLQLAPNLELIAEPISSEEVRNNAFL